MKRNKGQFTTSQKFGLAAAGLGGGIAAGLLKKKFAAKPKTKITTTERVVDFSELPPDIQVKFANK